MIVTVGTTYELVLTAAKTTNDMPWLLSYTESGTPDAGERNKQGNSNGTTPVELLAFVTDGDRMVNTFSIHNADTASKTIVIRHSINGVTYTQAKTTLLTLETLYYERGRGWYVIDTNGNTRVSTAAGAGAPTTVEYLVGASDAGLSAERVVTDTATVTWDLGTAAQAKANVPDNAITYAKMQDVSATDKVLGRSTAGAGDPEEIACTAAGRALIDDANAAAQRTTLGLGGAALVADPIPIANGGTGQTAKTAAFDALSPLAARGDLLTRDASNNVKLVIGAAGKVVKSDGTDVLWGYPITVLSDWVWQNLAASQTDLIGVRSTTNWPSSFKMPFAGRIKGVSVAGTAARSAGTATFKAFKNAADSGVNAVIDGTNTTNSTGTGDVAFAAGDILDIRVTTDAGFLPVSTEYKADIWITVTPQ